MADIVVDTDNKNPKELVGQGIRAYILQDYNSAVAALSKASELLVAEYGDDLHDCLAEVYLYYGKSLLGLSREEAEALGDAVPKNLDESDDEEVENVEEGDENAEGGEENAEEGEGKAESDKTNGESTTEKKEAASGSNDAGPGTSNGTKTGAGELPETTEEKPEDDEEPTDLQVAWEVLELAKTIYQRHGDDGKRNLAETLVVLGEISLESENFEAAINDIKEGLQIQKDLFGKDSRTVAESLYKLGMAYSTNSQINEAIESFKESLQYLQNRINHLEKVEDKKDEIEEEISEIKALIPDIEEKISDMLTYKDETLKQLVSAVTSAKVSEPPSSSSASSSSDKPVSNISHLVKRKRKLDEIAEEQEEIESNPTKKPAT